MAVSRGAGTEIIRTAWFEDIDSTSTTLIMGEQHHIYTILNINVYCSALNAVTDQLNIYLVGYDSKAGTSAQHFRIFGQVIPAASTFVWNDKFSFNGFEPVNFTGPMDDATKQNAIADQGSSVAQYLYCHATHASDDFEIGITYIDQNNA